MSVAALGTSPPQLDRTDIVNSGSYLDQETVNAIEVNYQISQATPEVVTITCPANEAAFIMVKNSTENIEKCFIQHKLLPVEINLLSYRSQTNICSNKPDFDIIPYPGWQSISCRC